MSAAVFVKKIVQTNSQKVVLADVTLDSSYPTGGEVLTPALFGLNGIDHVVSGTPNLGGFVSTYDPAINAIKLFVTTSGTTIPLVELANAESAATAVVPLVVFGN